MDLKIVVRVGVALVVAIAAVAVVAQTIAVMVFWW